MFSVYLIYDIQKTVGSMKFDQEYSVDDYALAAMNMYLMYYCLTIVIWILFRSSCTFCQQCLTKTELFVYIKLLTFMSFVLFL